MERTKRMKTTANANFAPRILRLHRKVFRRRHAAPDSRRAQARASAKNPEARRRRVSRARTQRHGARGFFPREKRRQNLSQRSEHHPRLHFHQHVPKALGSQRHSLPRIDRQTNRPGPRTARRKSPHQIPDRAPRRLLRRPRRLILYSAGLRLPLYTHTGVRLLVATVKPGSFRIHPGRIYGAFVVRVPLSTTLALAVLKRL